MGRISLSTDTVVIVGQERCCASRPLLRVRLGLIWVAAPGWPGWAIAMPMVVAWLNLFTLANPILFSD